MNGIPKRAQGEVLLEIRELKIDSQAKSISNPILKGVDLTLRRGEVLGVIGESGAGKSTLGLASMGFVRSGCRIRGGSIVFDGIDLIAASEKERCALRGSRIAYVAQSASAAFNPAHRLLEQTIETALDHQVMTRGEAEADAIDLYGRLQLPDPANIGKRYPHQVSGGQLQRAMTAMAMSCRPDLIIFDEPTTALDVTTQVEVLASMRDIVEQFNTAALYITHDLAVVAQMAHRVMVLRHGQVVEVAPTREMVTSPKAEYTKTLWAVRTLAKPEKAGADIVLQVRGVAARYGYLSNALDDISVSVPRGRTVAVVGESGSGKSTLARVIAGLLPPHQGDILFDGKPLPRALASRDKDTLRRIQMIYQSADTALNPRQRVHDIIGRPLEFYMGHKGKARDGRVAELLEQVELSPDLMSRLPAELSGGQKQRVSIARSLAAQPDLIICDEVTSALDQVVQKEILKFLMRMQDETGISYLFITHDINTVRVIADEVVVMRAGKIVDKGPKSTVLEPPHHPYTDLLLSSVPEIDPDWLTGLLRKRDQGLGGGAEAASRTSPSPRLGR